MEEQQMPVKPGIPKTQSETRSKNWLKLMGP
jgi:hypothetical protein